MTALRHPPIAPEAVFASHADRIAVGIQGTGEIILYSAALEPVLVIHVPGRERAVDRERTMDFVMQAAEEQESPLLREISLEEAEYLPSTQPSFGRIVFDSEGSLWVEEYLPPYEGRDPDWWVFDDQGEFVARVIMPDSGTFQPHVFLGDRIIGISRNAVDVPFVERRRIER